MRVYRRSITVLGVTFLVYALLVATHLGEFWPFSIYPMFSQGGKPWSRALVLDVSDEPDLKHWQAQSLEELPGEPFPLLEHGIDPIDLANFVAKTRHWNEARVAGLKQMFYDQVDTRNLLVLRVDGRIDARDSVVVQFVPYALLRRDTVVLNPDLPR